MKKIISLILCTFVICLCCSCSDTSNFKYYKYQDLRAGKDRGIYLIFKDDYFIKYSSFYAYGIPTEIYKASGCSSIPEYIKSEQKSCRRRYGYDDGKIENRQIYCNIDKTYTNYDTNQTFSVICYIYGGSGGSDESLIAKLDL